MVDPAIIKRVKKKDQEAFRLMYDQTIAYVFSIVKRYVTNESDYKDVLQNIYARVFLKMDTYDAAKGVFKYWIRRIAINQCIELYRQGKSPSLWVPMDQLNEADDGSDPFLSQLSKQEIEKFLAKMPSGYRQVFMLVIVDEYTHKEVGELLGISTETSRSQLSRAKSWLAKNLSRKNSKKYLSLGL